MTIRKWNYTDIALIAEFQKKHFPDYWTYSQLADGFLSGRLSGYLVEKDGKVIACSAINFSIDDADLVNILVAHEYRKQGIADSLMSKMLSDCMEIELKTLFLEVRESNMPAINLYQKYGFTQVGKRPKYYRDGETALVMKKEFKYN